MSQLTQGPWHVFSIYAEHEVRTPTDTLVAVVIDRDAARLIAAAPDLLAFVQNLIDFSDSFYPPQRSVYQEAVALVAKATTSGEQG